MEQFVGGDDPKKGLRDVRSFVGACNFYRRHIHNFTYSSATRKMSLLHALDILMMSCRFCS